MIKKLTEQQIPIIMNSEHFPYSFEQVKKMMINCNYVCWGWFENEQLTAYILSNISDKVDIIWIYTFNEHRHHGYATTLIQQIHSEIKRELVIEVKENNIPAINFYKHLGFKLINLRKHYYPNKINALVMQLK
ncbi:MAG: GNAT family N-acetyltransferase [Mycoplasmataceae bacterium]|nr:GNAT family N-acetyltransferase [Mycoplasmataceae bacterium]